MPRLKRLMRELLRHRPFLIDVEERGEDFVVGQQARAPVVAPAVCLAYTFASGCPISATAWRIVSAWTYPSPSEGRSWSAAMERRALVESVGGLVNSRLTG